MEDTKDTEDLEDRKDAEDLEDTKDTEDLEDRKDAGDGKVSNAVVGPELLLHGLTD